MNRFHRIVAITAAAIFLVVQAPTSGIACSEPGSAETYQQPVDVKPMLQWRELNPQQRAVIEEFKRGLFDVAEGAEDAQTVPMDVWTARVRNYLRKADENATFRVPAMVGSGLMCGSASIKIAIPPRMEEVTVDGPVVVVKGKVLRGNTAAEGVLNQIYFGEHIDRILQVTKPGFRKTK